MKLTLLFIISLAFVQSSLKECEAEWAKIFKEAQGILSPNPSDYTKMFLYSGFMINNLGQYDPCTDISIAKFTIIQFGAYPGLVVALCGPKACTEADYYQLMANISSSNPLSGMIRKNSPKLAPYLKDLSEIKAESFVPPVIFPKEYIDHHFKDYETGPILMIIFISMVSAIGVVATVTDYLISSSPPLKQENSNPQETSLFIKLLLCFSIITNLKKLFTSRSQERLGKKDSLDILNSCRVFSIGWVVLGHVLFMLWSAAIISNPDKLLSQISSSDMILPISGEASVDTFFWLSGFLVGYLLIIEINSPRKMNWIMVYVHRYLRLTPLLLFVISFFWALQKHIGNGPMWYNGDFVNFQCKNYWWTDIFYINNIVPNYHGSVCLSQAWYLANDMQFFIFTPFLLYIYNRFHKSILWILVLFLNLLSILTSGIIADHYSLNAMPSASTNEMKYYRYYYTKPYNRCGPYVLGVLCGLIVYSYKKYQDKNIIYDSYAIWVAKMFENRYMRYTVAFFGMVLINVNLFVPYDTYKHPGDRMTYSHWNHDENVVYIAFNKATYGLGLSLVLLPALLGHFPWMTWILSWEIWTPLARMTYCVYLIHYNVLDISYRSQKVATIFDEFTLIRDSIFFFVLSHILALPFILLIEMPGLAIEKLAFSSVRTKSAIKEQEKSIILQPLTKE